MERITKSKRLCLALVMISVMLICALCFVACGGTKRQSKDPNIGGDSNGDTTGGEHTSHNYTATETVDPTCVDRGYTIYTCTCGDSYNSDYVDATGEHTYTRYEYNDDATCVANGTETAICDVCHVEPYTRTKANTATGEHTYTTYTYNNDATCVANGTETATCDVCHAAPYTREKSNTATGEHIYTRYTYNNDATCITDGTETAICDVCHAASDTQTKANTATGIHNYNERHRCSECNYIDTTVWNTSSLYLTSVTYNGIEGYCVSGVNSGSEGIRSCYIPEEYNNKPIIAVGYRAFRQCYNLEKIEIPDSVISISAEAFYATAYYNCEENWEDGVLYVGNYLIKAKQTIPVEYTISDGIIAIATEAFSNCNDLISVEIPNSVIDIGSEAFYNCSSLANTNIPNNITSIKSGTFENCRSLTNIEIPNSVTSIGNDAFEDCSSLANVVFGNSVRSIGSCAFYGCNLTSIELPKSVKIIANAAFSNCDRLSRVDYMGDLEGWCGISLSAAAFTSAHYLYINNELVTDIVIPDGVTQIQDGAFICCSSLTSVEIPSSVEDIFGFAFYNCNNLTKVTIPSSVGGIYTSAFENCYNLTSIEISNSVAFIRSDAFKGCSSLTIYCEPKRASSYWEQGWNSSQCPVVWDCKNNDKDKDGYTYAIIDGLRYSLRNGLAIIVGQPRNISGEIVIPTYVTFDNIQYLINGIKERAFYECKRLTKVVIPNIGLWVGNEAFYGCSVFMTICCSAPSKPREWNSNWNPSNCPVIWRYVEQNQ